MTEKKKNPNKSNNTRFFIVTTHFHQTIGKPEILSMLTTQTNKTYHKMI